MVSAAATEPAWLQERRRRGASLSEELPLPDAKAKGWEFTDLAGLDLDGFVQAPGTAQRVSEASEEGVVVTSLREAVETHGELLHSRLGSLVSIEDPFVARNDAAWSDGVLIHVPAGSGVRADQDRARPQ